MIEQISNAIMGVAFFADTGGTGVTGLTVTVDAWRVINSAGTPSPTQVATDAAATSLGGGFYAYILAAASVTVEASYVFKFKTTSTSVRDKQLPAMWTVGVAGVEFLDSSIAGVQADTDNIQTRLPAALVSGRIDASVGAMAANTLTASALATDAVNEIVDQTWDEVLSGHLTPGTTGAALDDAAAGASSGGALNVEMITIDGQNLRGYGSHNSQALSASVFDLAIPVRATVIGLQATGADIYFTDDGTTTPSSTVGFVLHEGAPPIFLSLNDFESEPIWKFLRSSASSVLQYRYYRPD